MMGEPRLQVLGEQILVDALPDAQRLHLENLDLRQKLTECNIQLGAVNQELDVFAGRIAHDLQAVMQVTEGFAAVLQRGAAHKLDDREQHYLQRIVDTSARGNRLVGDLLSFARLGVHPINFRPVALALALQKARQLIAEEVQGRQVEWIVGDLPTVRGDEILLQQVFANLLSNALKYSRGRPMARIQVDAVVADPGYEIRVRDNGVGFDADFADRLFRPFERLHRADQFEGNGMGLANVRRIIERHGGSVRAETFYGEGALFAFSLPVTTCERAEFDAVAPAAAQAPRETASLRILVVDDDPMVLLSLRNMLEMDGHEVETAAGGLIGVEAFTRARAQGLTYDAVITDFGMPHMDGREVAHAIKQASPGTLVIMLTGWGGRMDTADDRMSDVDKLLGKPPRLAQVREALAAATERVA